MHLLEFPLDVVFSVLELLSAKTQGDCCSVSHLFLLLVNEIQRRPMLISHVGDVEGMMNTLRRKLLTKPTIAIMFSSGDLGSSAVKNMIENELPPDVQLIGAHTSALQATNSECEMVCDENRDRAALMLGHFPEAKFRSFFFSYHVCEKAAEKGITVLQENGLSLDQKWGVFMILSCGQASRYAEEIINLLQTTNPDAALVGGLAGEQVIQAGDGILEVNSNGIVILAFAGNVPVTALVSRGCVPVSEVYNIEEADITTYGAEAQVTIESLELQRSAAADASTDTKTAPLDAAILAQSSSDSRGPMYAGLSQPDHYQPYYTLYQVGQQSFASTGCMTLLVDAASQSYTPETINQTKLQFYQLNPQACKDDLRRSLENVRAQVQEQGKEVLGGVMFSCGARGPVSHFFNGEREMDASLFARTFPHTPMLGFYAGGEIGPRALADAPPEMATQTGQASLQGFTAVFGLFTVPQRTEGAEVLRAMASQTEGQLQEAGRAALREKCERYALHFKAQGNHATKQRRYEDAVRSYSRGLVFQPENHVLYSNNSCALLNTGQVQEAVESAKRCVELKPDWIKGYFRQAKALVEVGDVQAADGCLQEALQLEPENQEVLELQKKIQSSMQE